ncbi:hypothetical protein ACTFIV_009264 [Dictyostelium citrinum]
MSRLIYVQSGEELDRHLKDSRVLVDFSAEWSLAPIVEKLSSEFTTFTFLYVDIDKLKRHPLAASIGSVPTFHVYVNGAKVSELVGATEQMIRQALESNK